MSAPDSIERTLTPARSKGNMLILNSTTRSLFAGEIWRSCSSEAFTLVVSHGCLRFSLTAHSLVCPLNDQGLVLVAPGNEFVIEAERDCHIGIVHFCLLPYAQHQKQTEVYTVSPYLGSISNNTVWHRLQDDLHQLSQPHVSTSGNAHIWHHQSLHEILTHIMQPAMMPSVCEDSRTLVDRSIAYIHQAYPYISGVDELAKRSHLEKRQYTRVFQQITGQSPLQYLTQYRMNRAKEHLLLEGSQVAHIAEKCGYKDEYYFIRRFKEVVGDSPRRYARTRRSVERIFAMQFVGELLALDIRPCAVSADMATLPFGESMDSLPQISPHIEDEALHTLAPELIVVADYFSPERIERLSQIAPVLVLAWDRSPRERFLHLAEALGREQEAALWLTRYDKLRQEVEDLSGARHHQQRAAVIGVEHGDIWLMAPRFFPVFHDSLGYRPIPHMLHSLAHHPHTRLVRLGLEQLSPLQEADHLFLLHKNPERFKSTLAALTRNPHWHALPAVRERRVTILGESWTFYDIMSHYRQLVQLRQRLVSISNQPDLLRQAFHSS